MNAAPVYRFAVVAAVAAMPSAAFSQAAPAPRDAVIEQAIQDTLGASLKRRGYSSTDPKVIAAHQAVTSDIAAATEQGRSLTGVSTGNQTWAETIKGLLQSVARGFFTPIRIGSLFDKPNEGNGTFAGGGGMSGGGGASGSWELDCSLIDISFDAEGNLIIPSYSLKVGEPVKLFAGHWESNTTRASSLEAAIRWDLHQRNATRIPQDHWGVVSVNSDNTVTMATVAYRNASNVIVPRATFLSGAYQATAYPNGWHGGSGYPEADKNCPVAEVSGGDFHFYSDGMFQGVNYGGHLHGCTMYAPNPELGEAGYFVNKKTTIPMNGTTFPGALPEGWKACALDRSFIRRLTDAIARKVLKTPTTPPYDPITVDDVRMPPDASVNDLGDNPTTGTRPPPNETNVNTPPPPPPPTPTPPPSVDFGPDPGIGTPGDPQAPDNIMDPIFDWLPDLPSIQLNTAGATCPTWTMQPFQGPEWTLTMDDHCPFIADNQALISTIMILGFTVGAAMIILRA